MKELVPRGYGHTLSIRPGPQRSQVVLDDIRSVHLERCNQVVVARGHSARQSHGFAFFAKIAGVEEIRVRLDPRRVVDGVEEIHIRLILEHGHGVAVEDGRDLIRDSPTNLTEWSFGELS